MEVGGYVMLAIVAVLALGCINSSIKAHKTSSLLKRRSLPPNDSAFHLSFIFIQCGSGVHFDGRRFHIERRTAVPRCALFVLSEISAARRIRRFLPFRSICRRAATGPQSYFWLRESPAISRRSTRRGRKDWCTRRRSGCSDPAPSGPAQRTADRQTRRPRSAPE